MIITQDFIFYLNGSSSSVFAIYADIWSLILIFKSLLMNFILQFLLRKVYDRDMNSY